MTTYNYYMCFLLFAVSVKGDNPVGPPSIPSIEPGELVIPVQGELNEIICRAIGVPAPTITWKKDGETVSSDSSSPIYQTGGSNYSTLHFSNAAKTGVGYYVCSAQNKVRGEKKEKKGTVFVRGKLTLVNRNTNLPESAFQSSTISCTFEGYPIFDVYWKWKKSGIWNGISSSQQGGIFKVQTIVESTTPLVQKTSTLNITLAEYLGPTTVLCYATNKYENSSDTIFQLNTNLLIGGNRSYRIYHEKKKSFTKARTHCQSLGRDLVKIPNMETQHLLATKLTNLGVEKSLYIGAKRKTEGKSTIWRWLDQTFMYNETKHGRYSESLGNIVDGVYVFWNIGAPSSKAHMNYACLRNNEYHGWCTTRNRTSLGFICESAVPGAPTSFDVRVCGINIQVTFSSAIEAVGIKHRVELLRSGQSELHSLAYYVPMDTRGIQLKFLHIEPSTTYTVTITVCPEVCTTPLRIQRTLTTPIETSSNAIQYLYVMQQYDSNVCILQWAITDTVVDSFEINTESRPVGIDGNPKQEAIESVSSDIRAFEFVAVSNINYSFFIRANTHAGIGTLVTGIGDCVGIIDDSPPKTDNPTSPITPILAAGILGLLLSVSIILNVIQIVQSRKRKGNINSQANQTADTVVEGPYETTFMGQPSSSTSGDKPRPQICEGMKKPALFVESPYMYENDEDTSGEPQYVNHTSAQMPGTSKGRKQPSKLVESHYLYEEYEDIPSEQRYVNQTTTPIPREAEYEIPIVLP